MKKWTILILSALCISCFSIATACSKEKNNDLLVDFVDETVEIELGDIISVHDFLKVYDKDGNLYSATFELTDSTGSPVMLMSNEFSVTDTTGYTLVLSARDPKTGEVIATRTVQLKTVDKSAPIITVGDMVEYGTVGKELYIPLIFDDAGQNYSTSVTVMHVPYRLATNGYDESSATEVASEHETKGDASFTPERVGRHKIIVEAWDGTDKEAAINEALYNAKTVYMEVKGSANEIEGFDLPETAVAVYGVDGTVGKKQDAEGNPIAGKSVEWHDTYQGRDGVVSMKPSKTANSASTGFGGAYYVGSFNKVWTTYTYDYVDENGVTQKKNYNGKSPTDGDFKIWDYVSMWIYIPGANGQTVQVSGEKGLNAQQVPFNQWYEYRVYLDYFVEVGWSKPFLTLSTNVNNGHDKRNMLWVGEDETANYTVYLDSVSYERSEEAMTISVSDVNGKAAINVTPKAGYETALANAKYTYYACALEGTAVAKVFDATDGTFAYDASIWTDYWVCARVEVNGKVYLQNYVAKFEKIESPSTLIEGFESASSTSVVYGVDATSGKATKSVQNETAQWHQTFQNRDGVVSMQPAKTANSASTGYGGAYYVGSTKTKGTLYPSIEQSDGTIIKMQDAYIEQTNERLWDYVSMWIYIPGEAGQTVQVSGDKGLNAQQVPFNEWYEYRVYYDFFVEDNWLRPQWTLSTTSNANQDVRSMLWVGSDETANYTVYLDSISYVKYDDAMTISVSDSNGSVEIAVTPNTGYDLTGGTFTYYVRAIKTGTTAAKTLTVTDAAFTPDATKWTKYWVYVRVDVEGKTYVKHLVYELPTEA